MWKSSCFTVDTSPMEQLLPMEACRKDAATPRTSFRDIHATLIQLKSVATIENRNQCVYAVIAPAPSARASNQYEVDVWFGAYLKGNTLFLITEYFCDEDPTCDDWWIVPVAHGFPLKNVHLFFFNICLLYCIHFWLHRAGVSSALSLFS